MGSGYFDSVPLSGEVSLKRAITRRETTGNNMLNEWLGCHLLLNREMETP